MTRTLREAILAAEIAVTADSEVNEEQLSQMVTELGPAQPGEEEDRTYLAVLLNSLDLVEEALTILEPSDDEDLLDDYVDIAVLRNMQGVLLAGSGRYSRALETLEEALTAARAGTLRRSKILANLAAVSLRFGRTAKAASWVIEARVAGDQTRDTAVDVLLTSVEAGIARAHGDTDKLREAASALAEVSRLRIAEVGNNHPQALTAVATLAATEFERARAESSPRSRERALETLEVISQRLAAELGANSPQALISIANFTMAELMSAFEDESTQDISPIVDTLTQISRRIDMVLGGGHPQALRVSENLTLAIYAHRMLASINPDPVIADVIENAVANDNPREDPRSQRERLESEQTPTRIAHISPEVSSFYERLLSIRRDPKIRRLALRLAGDDDIAEDALQQAFLSVARVRHPQQIANLRAYFYKVLIRETYHLRGQFGALTVGDFAALREDVRLPGRETARSLDETVIANLMANVWLARIARERSELLARVPGRSTDSSRYREVIVATAERVLLAALEGVTQPPADADETLRAAYPEWFGEEEVASNSLHQRFARARADIRSILRAVVDREEL